MSDSSITREIPCLGSVPLAWASESRFLMGSGEFMETVSALTYVVSTDALVHFWSAEYVDTN